MPKIKIIKEYESTERYRPGQIVDVSNADTLVKEGNAVLVDEKGYEIEPIDIVKQLRRLVTTDYAVSVISQLISRHPDKERIVAELVEEGVITPRPKIKDTPILTIIGEVVERPAPDIKKEDVLKKIEELKNEAYAKK